MNNFEDILKGGDLRSLGKSNRIINLVNTQRNFDELFQLLFHTDRLVVMRAADAIEKITIENPLYLNSHAAQIIQLCNSAENKELKWHLAQLVVRIRLSLSELKEIWKILMSWVKSSKESRIVRVNSLQSLYILMNNKKDLQKEFDLLINRLKKENIPSLNARIKKFSNAGN